MDKLKNFIIDQYQSLIFLCFWYLSLSIASQNKDKITVLFVFIIINFILQILDSGAIILLSIASGLLLKLFSEQTLLHSFGQSTVWQIMCFLFLSKTLIKSGLAYKISLYIMYFFGKTPLTLSYGFCLLTLLFALILPTSSARIGGIFIPILSSLFSILSKEDENLKSMILKTVIYSNTIASAMFITASSGNFYIQDITKQLKVFISSKDWTFFALVPGLCCLLVTPLLINYLIQPPTGNFKKIHKKITEEMSDLEEISFEELIILFIFISLFPLVFLSSYYDFSFLGSLFAIVSILVLFNALSFETDILKNTEAWSLFFWMSHLLFLSSLITQNQSLNFIHHYMTKLFIYLPSNFVFLAILTIYGYSQYFFASSTVHASALYALSFEMAIQHNYPPFFSALTLAYISNLFSGLTTYSASEIILLTTTFDTDAKEFNKYGFIISSFLFILWLLCGMIWWEYTGVLE